MCSICPQDGGLHPGGPAGMHRSPCVFSSDGKSLYGSLPEVEGVGLINTASVRSGTQSPDDPQVRLMAGTPRTSPFTPRRAIGLWQTMNSWHRP